MTPPAPSQSLSRWMADGPSQVRRQYLVAAPNSTDRSVVAVDDDCVASVVAVPVIPATVAVAVTVTVMPHSHIACGVSTVTCAEAGETIGMAMAIPVTANKPSKIVRRSNLSGVVMLCNA